MSLQWVLTIHPSYIHQQSMHFFIIAYACSYHYLIDCFQLRAYYLIPQHWATLHWCQWVKLSHSMVVTWNRSLEICICGLVNQLCVLAHLIASTWFPFSTIFSFSRVVHGCLHYPLLVDLLWPKFQGCYLIMW